MPKPLNTQNGRVKDKNNVVANGRSEYASRWWVSPHSTALPPSRMRLPKTSTSIIASCAVSSSEARTRQGRPYGPPTHLPVDLGGQPKAHRAQCSRASYAASSHRTFYPVAGHGPSAEG